MRVKNKKRIHKKNHQENVIEKQSQIKVKE